MNTEQVFRLIFIAIFITSSAISIYYRRKARMSGEAISRRQESPLVILLRAFFALPLILSFFAYMINPSWIDWCAVALPVWVRGIGAGFGILCLPLLWWVFRTIGCNISETVLTKKEHMRVTTGPFRWVRHPLYSVTILLFFSYGVIAGNWWMLAFIARAVVMILWVVIPRGKRRHYSQNLERRTRNTSSVLASWFLELAL